MNKTSQLFLYLFLALAAIAFYNSTVPAPAGVSSGTRFLALSGFFLITVTLLIGPLAVIWPQRFAQLVEPRRAVGIASFFLVLFHGILSLSFQLGWDFSLFFSYLPFTAGTIALAIFTPLALTSADWATKLLGTPVWKGIQRFNYLAFALSLYHFIFKANGLDLSRPNLVEFLLVIFALATIGFQVAGFFVVRRRKIDALKKQVSSQVLQQQQP
ncbi:MAG: ferric reductase-like transmembrane domain-containing protein [archaeon]